jgi:ABC-type nitrate/sulfonate/bicarbonate transport system permease component
MWFGFEGGPFVVVVIAAPAIINMAEGVRDVSKEPGHGDVV